MRHVVQPGPLREGERIRLTIDDLGHEGEGVGRYEGMAVFVPGAAPGDWVEARITQVKKAYARAELQRVLQPSSDRTPPLCPYSERCGGCQLQHIQYEKQLAWKQKAVKAAMVRLGGLEKVVVHPTLGMDDPWQYRNKAQFPIRSEQGRTVIGFFTSGSHRVVDIDRCVIQETLTNQILQALRRLVNVYRVPVYDYRTGRGGLRHLVTRIAAGGAQAMVILVTGDERFPHGEEMARALIECVPAVRSVYQNINSERPPVVLGKKSRHLAGDRYIIDTIYDMEFKISPLSFFQVNPSQTRVLYKTALQYAALSGNETVIDLYCGIGTISLLLARHAEEVIGIEWVEEAVADAEANAARNGIKNVRFFAGDAAERLPRLAEEGLRADVIVLDPPRKGADEAVLAAIGRMQPRRIVYVSCNSATLARDCARLEGFGYTAVEVQPVDMFPHTAHIESVALLVR